jgi:SAM-dependent methyltransferase
MNDELRYLRDNRKLWDEWTKLHTVGEFYDVQSFRDGTRPVRIDRWEQDEVGDVAGARLLHLQCHFGLDTLSWARLGAVVTGVDFSENAIAFARELAADVGIHDARFLVSNVYELSDVLHEQFDVVYTSRGALGWLPSVQRWAEVLVRHVKPGGVFYMHEAHPVMWAFDDATAPNPVTLSYPYWEGDALSFPVRGSYADPEADVDAEVEHGWNHGLGEIATALTARGVHLEFLHEFDWLDWPEGFLERGDDGRHRWPAGQRGTLPLMFSLRATKPT